MKIIFSLSILVGFLHINILNAQDNRFQIGGTLGTSFNNTKSDQTSFMDSKSYNFSSSVMFGYYLSKNFVLGTKLSSSIDYSHSDNNSINTKTTSNNWFVSPFIKYYLNDVFFYSQLSIGKSFYKYDGKIIDAITGDYYDYKNENKFLIYGGSIGMGYRINLSGRTSFEPEISYNYFKFSGMEEDDIDYKTGGLHFTIGMIYNW